MKVKISTAQTSSTQRAVFNTKKYTLSSDLLKDEVKNEPEFTVTPSAFILDIDTIRLFNPVDSEDLTKGPEESIELVPVLTYPTPYHDGDIIPKRFNMLSSRGMASVSIPLSILAKDWHGLSLMIRPEGTETTNGMWAGSIIGVNKSSLPSGITEDDIVNVIGELPFGIEYSDDTVWFSFEDLFPFKMNGHVAYITFYDGVDSVYFINPEGEMGNWVYGGELSTGNMAGAVFPMDTINLSDLQNPELNISIDTENLIEFYPLENGKYYASFAKANPFPFRVTVEEYNTSVFLYEEQTVSDIKDAVPFDCFDYKMVGKNGICHILVHTQANYSGISYTEVFRSSNSTFDENAVLIYSGENLSIVDYDCPADTEVYYFIRSVNTAGDKSDVKAFYRIDGTGYGE